MNEHDLDGSTAKYLIYVKFTINGVVERSDVIGAIFGQTEGLLGEGLDLRELQKSSRIGRIVVNLKYSKSRRKTMGTIIVPSSLDRVETAVLAAALETVDRVGPCDAKVVLQKIEDIRETKRKQIVKRATQILQNWEREIGQTAENIVELVSNQARVSLVEKFGPEQLPCGPEVETSDSLIVVEGRADVINLLKQGIKNVIAVEGTHVPQSVIELTKRKVTTAFLDGDRGGDLILKELIEVADIDYVARAPRGREVEDLSGKEILKALRNKVPIEQVIKELNLRQTAEIPPKKSLLEDVDATFLVEEEENHGEEKVMDAQVVDGFVDSEMTEVLEGNTLSDLAEELDEDLDEELGDSEGAGGGSVTSVDFGQKVPSQEKSELVTKKSREEKSTSFPGIPSQLHPFIASLNTREGILLAEGFKERQRVPVGELHDALKKSPAVEGLIFDGIVTQRSVDIASEKGAKFIIGAKIGEITKKPANLAIYQFS